MASAALTVHWRLAWYARLVLNMANATMIGGRSVIPRRLVRWLCMNHWQMRVGDSGKWVRRRIDQAGRPV